MNNKRYIYILFRKYYDEDSLELFPIMSSNCIKRLKKWLNKLLEESEFYDKHCELHAQECKTVIRNYLLENYGAITGWRDVRERVGTSYPITKEEKDKVINFLCNNYSFHYGPNIIEVEYNNGFIDKYCDIKQLSKPYPKLPAPPKILENYYLRNNFKIEKIQYI